MEEKLSEIRARAESGRKGRWLSNPAFNDIIHLLDLVERLGKVLKESRFVLHQESNHAADFDACCRTECAEARALLKELER